MESNVATQQHLAEFVDILDNADTGGRPEPDLSGGMPVWRACDQNADFQA